MDDGYSWGNLWWCEEEFIIRFSAQMGDFAGSDFDYTEVAKACLGVIEDHGDENMTPEEWADAELEAWRDSY